MALKEVIVDFGTSFITIYEGGVLLKEPSVVIMKEEGGKKELVAAGRDALARTSLKTGESFVRPIREGAVKYPQEAASMLSYFLSKSVKKQAFCSYRVYVIVSSGIMQNERRAVEQVFHQSGYRDVVLIESVLTMLPYAGKKGGAVAIFGGGTLEVGIVSEKGIVSACSLNLAGQNVTEEVQKRVHDVTHVNISTERAEHLKTELASLYAADVKAVETVGRDALDGSVKSAVLRADALYPTVAEAYGKMFSTIESLLSAALDEKSAEIVRAGLVIAGGGSNIRGLHDAIAAELKLPCSILDDSQNAVVKGCAKLLKNAAFRDVIVK